MFVCLFVMFVLFYYIRLKTVNESKVSCCSSSGPETMRASCHASSSQRRRGAPLWLWEPLMWSWHRQVVLHNAKCEMFSLLVLRLVSDICSSFKPSCSTLDFLVCLLFFSTALGEGLRFPEDHWSDANAVLEDGHRGDIQRWPTKPARQHGAVEGKCHYSECWSVLRIIYYTFPSY